MAEPGELVKPFGVTVLPSAISSIDAEGLRYRGYRVEDLAARCRYEAVAWLLWTGELPSAGQRAALQADLAAGAALPAALRTAIAALPGGAPPSVRLQAALPLLGLHVAELGAPVETVTTGTVARLLSAVVLLVAEVAAAGSRPGADLPLPPPEAGIAARFLAALRGSGAAPETARALEQVLILYADHELNASTFAGRVAASTRADLISCVLAALSTLRGPLHGGIDRQLRSLFAAAQEEGAESVVERYARAGAVLPGFGHAVYRGMDPRAVLMRELALRLAPAAGQGQLLETTEGVVEAARVRGVPPPNVDLYTLVLYRALDIPDQLSSLVFAMGRLAGWCAHILEQYERNRLIRPRAAYVGAEPRELPAEWPAAGD
ncbi:MAG TPA: citrate/2-methylcitrate synthase [Dehalococcoidia bacterium]|nr:citrate/2-methylcitrate synthase [Dehalococcoidia bacterium]